MTHRWRMLWLLLLTVMLVPMATGAQETCVPTPTPKTEVTLAWTPPTVSAGAALMGYVLERQVDTGPWTVLPPPALTATTASDTNLTPGHTYTYRLSATATLADGSTGTSAYATAGTPPPCIAVTVVPAPGNLTALPQCGRDCMTLAWTSADPMLVVHIERRMVPETTYSVVDDVPGTSYADAALPLHTTFCYRVRYSQGTAWTPETCGTTAKH